MRTEAIAMKTETAQRLPRKTNEHRIRDHSRRNSNLDPGWKLEDVMRITMDGKSHHPHNLSKKKQRIVLFTLKDPATLREWLAHQR